MRHGRRRPYTTLGIRRLPCSVAGCPNRGEFQWQICSDNRLWRPLCRQHDVELNEMMLRFIRDPDAEAKAARYRESVAGR